MIEMLKIILVQKKFRFSLGGNRDFSYICTRKQKHHEKVTVSKTLG